MDFQDLALQGPVPDSQGYCSFCHFIMRQFRHHWGPDWDDEESRLRPDKYADKPCHRQIRQYLQDMFSKTQLTDDIFLTVTFKKREEIRFMTSNRDIGVYKEIDLLPSTGTDLREKERIIDRDWIDLDLLKEWKSECLTKHAQNCCNPLSITRVQPDWLIDTYNDCIVSGKGITDFIALSYVWGASSWLHNERAILEALQKPGALSQTLSSEVISPTIRHAMGLTHALEERYLWADALCILQDDSQHSAHQLRLMGKIYASAKFTIVAADGDAAGGIAGINGISHSRNLSQTIVPLASNRKMVVSDANLTMGDRYFDRAWTFQEYALSQRVIMIKEKRIHWICSTRRIREGYGDNYPELRDGYRFDSPRSLSGYPDLHELGEAVSSYNSKTLSVPLDALAGVTGILEIFNRAFRSGFLYGLPLTYFHATLMWKNKEPMKRRVHSGNQHSILPGSRLPSWSWLGWETDGIVFDESDGTILDESCVTYGLVQWYSHESPSSSDRRGIGPCFPNMMRHVNDDNFSSRLGRGWTALEYNYHIDGPANMVLENKVYRHSSMPHNLFRYWFPIHDPHKDMISPMPPQHAFISCSTRRGWFRAAKPDTSMFPEAEVYDKNGEFCGPLVLSSKEEWTGFSARRPGPYRMIELVAICIRRYPKYRRVSYGALWVEWVDGVAYRKGVAEIAKKAWEKHDLEDVDLILG